MRIAILSTKNSTPELDARVQFPEAEVVTLFPPGSVDVGTLSLNEVGERLRRARPDALIVRGPTELQVYATLAASDFPELRLLVWRHGSYRELEVPSSN